MFKTRGDHSTKARSSQGTSSIKQNQLLNLGSCFKTICVTIVKVAHVNVGGGQYAKSLLRRISNFKEHNKLMRS